MIPPVDVAEATLPEGHSDREVVLEQKLRRLQETPTAAYVNTLRKKHLKRSVTSLDINDKDAQKTLDGVMKTLSQTKVWREAASLAPDEPRALHALGNALHQCDAPADALEVYARALHCAPSEDFPPNAPLLYDVPSPPLSQPSAPPAGGAAAGERLRREASNRPLTANILQHADGQPPPLPLRLGGASTAGDGLEW